MALEIRHTENGRPLGPNLLNLYSLSWKKAHIYPDLFLTTSTSLKSTPCCLCSHSVKLRLYFGHSAAPNPYNCLASLNNLRSDRGWHRSECEWLALSPNINVKQHHRWRENSYVFQVGGVLFIAFGLIGLWGVFRGEECVQVIWFVTRTKKRLPWTYSKIRLQRLSLTGMANYILQIV